MKKNLMSVIILGLVFANFVLTALLLFTVLPQTKKANKMIEDVCAAIDLELNSGDATGVSNVPIDNQEQFALNGGNDVTMSFKTGADGKSHYVVAKLSLTMNIKSDGYSTYGAAALTAQETKIQSDIDAIVHEYTLEEFNANREMVYSEILKDMQKLFGGDFIVSVNFSQIKTE